jgi:uncharacterized membrane protein
MSLVPDTPFSLDRPRPRRPFRAAVFRGLGGFIPPLLTVLVVLWMFGTVKQYVLEPVEWGTRSLLALSLSTRELIRDPTPPRTKEVEVFDGWRYYQTNDSRSTYAPEYVFATVQGEDGNATREYTGRRLYERYVEIVFLKWYYEIPAFLALFTLLLYFLGKLLAGRLGQFVWGQVERLIYRVPLVRNVYSAIKQVTEFLFNHKDFQFTRVVAIEYPRKGMWSIGFVTSEGFADIYRAAREPILTVLIPASPMSITGYTTTVLKREAIELNITIDQALEFIVSCGVVIPPHQVWAPLERAKNANKDKPHP